METATGFANDVQRYLNDEAVVACPPSAAYRFRKFARRNKTAFAITAVILLCLIVGNLGYKLASDSGDEGRAAGKTAFCRRTAGP